MMKFKTLFCIAVLSLLVGCCGDDDYKKYEIMIPESKKEEAAALYNTTFKAALESGANSMNARHAAHNAVNAVYGEIVYIQERPSFKR